MLGMVAHTCNLSTLDTVAIKSPLEVQLWVPKTSSLKNQQTKMPLQSDDSIETRCTLEALLSLCPITELARNCSSPVLPVTEGRTQGRIAAGQGRDQSSKSQLPSVYCCHSRVTMKCGKWTHHGSGTACGLKYLALCQVVRTVILCLASQRLQFIMLLPRCLILPGSLACLTPSPFSELV